jgi:transcriptional regulator with XRE-family HTH domain
MEILSIGEKIRRARIYKGCTLKELCGDKLSISRMSCIENDKVKPEEWVIEYIAQKLDMDSSYLKEGVKEQLLNNISLLHKNKNGKDYESSISYNLDYAEKYNYYDIAFTLMHILFCVYIETGQDDKMQIILNKYYDICRKSGAQENQLIYNEDMGKFFYVKKEYVQAEAYYNNLLDNLIDMDSPNYEKVACVLYKISNCRIKLRDFNKAYENVRELKKLILHVKDDLSRAEIYQMFAVLALIMKKDDFEQNESRSYEYYGSNNQGKAEAMFNYSCAMFDVGLNEKAVKYIMQGLRQYPKAKLEEYVMYLLTCISELLSRNEIKAVQGICDEAVDNSIELNDVKLIEKAYYYKSVMLQKLGEFGHAEMYMNLSLDALFKFGSKRQKFERYMEMGNMYHRLGQTNEALGYFTLALSLEKKI